eukprot:scaffold45231_cov35-Cyclotella_meneghiniana.AAC.1
MVQELDTDCNGAPDTVPFTKQFEWHSWHRQCTKDVIHPSSNSTSQSQMQPIGDFDLEKIISVKRADKQH